MVVRRATRVQRELEALVADVAAVHNEVSGVARIGVIGTTARWLVPPLLEAMAARYPKVRVVVVDATTTSLLPQVHSGQLDLAVLALPVRDPDVEAEPLFDEDLLVIAPADHPLADRERVTLAELAEHDLLLEPPGTAFRDDLDAQATERGDLCARRPRSTACDSWRRSRSRGSARPCSPRRPRPRWLTGDWKVVAVDGLTGRSVGPRAPPPRPAVRTRSCACGR